MSGNAGHRGPIPGRAFNPRQQPQPRSGVEVPLYAEVIVRFKHSMDDLFNAEKHDLPKPEQRVQVFRRAAFMFQPVGQEPVLLIVTANGTHHALHWDEVDSLEAVPSEIEVVVPSPA